MIQSAACIMIPWTTAIPNGVALDTTIDAKDTLKHVRVIMINPKDSIGVQVRDIPGGVEIQSLVQPKDPKLQVGMILQDISSVEELATRISKGPYPLELEFVASTIESTTAAVPQTSKSRRNEYIRRSIEFPKGPCQIQSRAGDVLEIFYEAFYEASDGRMVLYDSSDFRGTGQPYQTVLGSGDMIPGVDQGLYNMCPGEIRQLQIPPQLGYGPRARETFRIPVDYLGLEWRIELFSIDGTIRKDNNDQTREQRGG